MKTLAYIKQQSIVDDILSFFNESPGDFLPTNSSIITKHINSDGTNLKDVWKVIEGIKGISFEQQGQEYVWKHKVDPENEIRSIAGFNIRLSDR